MKELGFELLDIKDQVNAVRSFIDGLWSNHKGGVTLIALQRYKESHFNILCKVEERLYEIACKLLGDEEDEKEPNH